METEGAEDEVAVAAGDVGNREAYGKASIVIPLAAGLAGRSGGTLRVVL